MHIEHLLNIFVNFFKILVHIKILKVYFWHPVKTIYELCKILLNMFGLKIIL